MIVTNYWWSFICVLAIISEYPNPSFFSTAAEEAEKEEDEEEAMLCRSHPQSVVVLSLFSKPSALQTLGARVSSLSRRPLIHFVLLILIFFSKK